MDTLQPSPVRFIDIASDYAGQRIDNFLLHTLKGVPKSRIYRTLRKGEVRVNKARVRPDYRLQAGDRIRIPPLREGAKEASSIAIPGGVLERLAAAVLWEDRDVLVLNKPAGIAVHKGSGLDFGVIDAVRKIRPHASFLELAHRLDRETSGCLILAKSMVALRAIQAALQSGNMDKRYLALVNGSWTHGAIDVAANVRKVLRGGERMVEVAADGKPAHSQFRVVSLFRQASLMEVTIATGRTHQIRVHAAYCGHPIVGDTKYGDAEFNRRLARQGLKRLFLHAHSIYLQLGGREISVSAPFDESFEEALKLLKRM